MEKDPYIILQNRTTDELVKQVNEKIKDGYLLYGFPYRGLISSTDHGCTYQAMVLPVLISAKES
jgi:hypothetical protein